MMYLKSKKELQLYKYMRSWGFTDEAIECEIEKRRKMDKFWSGCAFLWVLFMVLLIYLLLFIG